MRSTFSVSTSRNKFCSIFIAISTVVGIICIIAVIRLESRTYYKKKMLDKRWKRNETLDKIVKDFISGFASLDPKPSAIHFVNYTANPCWQRGGSRLMDCLPAFYIGGFAKCSTTDLWRRLVKHPEILDVGTFLGFPRKEYKFWERRLYHDKNPMRDYISMFKKVAEDRKVIVGDGSVTTFSSTSGIRSVAGKFRQEKAVFEALMESGIVPPYLIVQYVSDAKFIIMMRNPTDRLYSHYMHFHRKFLIPKGINPSPQKFHASVLKHINVFQACAARRVESMDRCAYDEEVVALETREDPVFLVKGLYAVFIRDALQLVPRRNMIFIRSEDYVRDRKRYLARVLNFIGVAHHHSIVEELDAELFIPNTMDQTYISFEERKSDSDKMPMLVETRKVLDDFYKPFNEDLASLLNDERYLFIDDL